MTDNIDREIFDELFVKPLAKTPEEPDDEGRSIADFLIFIGLTTILAPIGLALILAVPGLIIYCLWAAFDWAGIAVLAGLLVATWALSRQRAPR